MEGSDEFSQSYDHYKILCKLASGHALTCLSLNIDKVLITKEGKILLVTFSFGFFFLYDVEPRLATTQNVKI